MSVATDTNSYVEFGEVLGSKQPLCMIETYIL